MTNGVPTLTLMLLLTNSVSITNWMDLSGERIEVGKQVIEQHVHTFTNLQGVLTVQTNFQTNIMMVQRYYLKKEWVPGPMPNALPPSPLSPNR